MINLIYPPELQLNKANTSDTEAPFLDLHLSIFNGFVSSKIYDKRDDFDFDIVNFPFLDGDVPRRPSYGVYISQLIRFARVCSHVDDFNTRNKCLTAKLLKQGYRQLTPQSFGSGELIKLNLEKNIHIPRKPYIKYAWDVSFLFNTYMFTTIHVVSHSQIDDTLATFAEFNCINIHNVRDNPSVSIFTNSGCC